MRERETVIDFKWAKQSQNSLREREREREELKLLEN